MPNETGSKEPHETAIGDGESCVYVSEGDELVHYVLDSRVPALLRRSSVTLPAIVQSGCRHSTLERLYIASSKGGFAADFQQSDEHYLTAFEIAPTGALTQFGESRPLPYRPVYISRPRWLSHPRRLQ